MCVCVCVCVCVWERERERERTYSYFSNFILNLKNLPQISTTLDSLDSLGKISTFVLQIRKMCKFTLSMIISVCSWSQVENSLLVFWYPYSQESDTHFYWAVITSGLSRWCSARISLALQETQEMWVWFLDGEDPPEKEMATHSSILAWRILQRSLACYSL